MTINTANRSWRKSKTCSKLFLNMSELIGSLEFNIVSPLVAKTDAPLCNPPVIRPKIINPRPTYERDSFKSPPCKPILNWERPKMNKSEVRVIHHGPK